MTRLGIGVPELVFIIPAAIIPAGLMVFAVVAARRARRFGYESTWAYLRAAPRSDAEKRDAADLALKGLVTCLLGVIFAPLVLIGLAPLFYGGRKLVYASMCLGLVDDADQPDV